MLTLGSFWLETRRKTTRQTKVDAFAPTRIVSKDDGLWRVEQILLDAEEANDWALLFAIELGRPREEARPVLELRRVEGAPGATSPPSGL
jgi:hypothetical protein